ncbi:MAG: hypothetical protein M0Z45_10860 [Actinomycetota bacterium]|nr:hypothetical protein [Actinomycetota bacterium]
MIEVEVRSSSYHFLSEATSYLVSKIAEKGISVSVNFRLRPRIGGDIEAILNSGARSVFLSTKNATFVSIDSASGVDIGELSGCDVLLVMAAGVDEYSFEVGKDDGSGIYKTLRTMLEEAEIYLKSS